LKWHLLSTLLILHSTAIKIQEAKESIDEEDPWPTSSRWSYITSFPIVITLTIKNRKPMNGVSLGK